MTSTETLALDFMALFSGAETGYGTYNMSNPVREENGKLRGKAKTEHAGVTAKLWENHLTGNGLGLGIIPIREDNTCVFGAIDIDSYTGLDLRAIALKLQRNKIPLVVCRSKSGGAHIYCFTRTPIAAATMKAKLSEIAGFIGHGGSEIFPKQTQLLVDRGDVGSWISVPYFNGIRGMRYAIDLEGNALSPEAFLMAAHSLAVGDEWFTELLVLNAEFQDGPPCLQALAQIGYPVGERNNGLYAIGVYLKKSRPDSWETAIDEFNHKYLQPPLTMPEVQGLIKSLRRKDYTYGCSKQPIAQHCNSTLCRTRKYGIGSGTGRFPVLGGLSKLNTKPPIWFWTIDGVRMELSTADLQDPRAFQRRCMDCLDLVPTMPSAPAWQAAVQHAMDAVTTISAPVDASSEGQFWEMMEKFCSGRAQALALEEISMGKPFTDKGRTNFRMSDLLAFLLQHKFFDFKSTKIASMLNDSGAKHHFANLKGRGVNYWSVPEFTKQTEPFNVPGEIKDGKEPF